MTYDMTLSQAETVIETMHSHGITQHEIGCALKVIRAVKELRPQNTQGIVPRTARTPFGRVDGYADQALIDRLRDAWQSVRTYQRRAHAVLDALPVGRCFRTCDVFGAGNSRARIAMRDAAKARPDEFTAFFIGPGGAMTIRRIAAGGDQIRDDEEAQARDRSITDRLLSCVPGLGDSATLSDVFMVASRRERAIELIEQDPRFKLIDDGAGVLRIEQEA